ncbi:EamA family transporter [Chloroflexota bacterium]
MDWTSTAILSAAALGAVNIIDSHLLTKRMPSFRAFMLLVGVIHTFYALVIFYIFPLPDNISVLPLLVAIASGIFRTVAVSIMLYSLQKTEVSQVIPVIHSYPIFVAMLAVPALGESLYALQWLAIVIVVFGAVVVSAGPTSTSTTKWHGRTLLLLLIASLCFALGDITTKYALTYISFWNGFSLTALCMSGTFLVASLRPRFLREIWDMPRRNSSLALLTFNETLAPVGITLSFWAIQRGPVSLVSTVIGSRPIFVVLYSLIFSRVFPDFLVRFASRKMLWLRLAATLMIFGGIAIIYLT